MPWGYQGGPWRYQYGQCGSPSVADAAIAAPFLVLAIAMPRFLGCQVQEEAEDQGPSGGISADAHNRGISSRREDVPIAADGLP